MGKYLTQARTIRAAMDKAGTILNDAQALTAIDLYRPWESEETVVLYDVRRHAGKLYRCAQAHTTQADWTPDVTPALWTKISVEEWPAWKQPLSTEAYPMGAKVTHKGFRWTSNVAANVWEPGVYGWTKAT